MGKQSRRQRKQLRAKPGAGEPSAVRVHSDRTPAVPVRTHPVVPPSASVSQGLEPTNVGWSSWPTSVKLVTIGILLLVAIGLYRRFTEVVTPEDMPVPDSSGAVPAGQGSPGSRAQVPAASSAAPESQ